jgi:glycosyltransferase involved in cell wall biosynthesis
MIYIYTHPLGFAQEFKYFIRKLFGHSRGPDAVASSLTRGLRSLNIPFSLNIAPEHTQRLNRAHVIAGIETLRWAIRMKEQGCFKKLSAGPNIVVTPDEADKILLNKNIDTVLLPSPWTRKLFCEQFPQLSRTSVLWPAGVDVPGKMNRAQTYDFLIFNKLKSYKLLNAVIAKLNQSNLSYMVIHYGKFSRKKYFYLLKKVKYMIYLGSTESQGLSLAEAWARNIPTLVYKDTVFRYKQIVWPHASSAPYLNARTGLFFTEKDIDKKLSILLKKRFQPRKYCKEHLSDIITTRLFLRSIGYKEKHAKIVNS